MNIQQLQYFVASVKYNSITKAAKKLFVSQPTISLAIKSLEEEFGVPFFERNNNQLTLTKEGKRMYSLSLNLIEEFNKTKESMQKFIIKQEKIKIGIPPMLGTFLFPPLIDEFSKTHPNIQVELSEYGSIDNRHAVAINEIDVALTVIDSYNLDPELDFAKLGETSLLFCVSPKHRLAKREMVDLTDIGDNPIILMQDNCLQSRIIEQAYLREGLKPNVRIRTNYLYTMIELLRYGDLGTFLFNQVIKGRDGIVGIPAPSHLILDIVMVWNKNVAHSRVVNEFMDFVKEKAKNYI